MCQQHTSLHCCSARTVQKSLRLLSRIVCAGANKLVMLLLAALQAVVKKDVYAAVDALRSRGVTQFASLGFCWGAAMAIQALHDAATFSAAGMLHPSLFGQVGALVAATAASNIEANAKWVLLVVASCDVCVVLYSVALFGGAVALLAGKCSVRC